MVFKYPGSIESLAKDVDEAKEVVDERYKEIFGCEQYKKLESLSDRLIIPECFYDSREKWNKETEFKLPENACNKMGLLLDTEKHDLEFDKQGRLKNRKFRTSVVFYIAEEALKYSGASRFTEKLIGSYVHEFDHFVTYALQEVPFYLINMILLNRTESEDLPPMRRLYSFIYKNSLEFAFERANRILDKRILESIGININLDWRGKEKKYQFMKAGGAVFGYPIGGDPFLGFDDDEAIRSHLNWRECARPTFNDEYLENILDSLKQMKVSKISLRELKNLHNNRKNKKRKG